MKWVLPPDRFGQWQLSCATNGRWPARRRNGFLNCFPKPSRILLTDGKLQQEATEKTEIRNPPDFALFSLFPPVPIFRLQDIPRMSDSSSKDLKEALFQLSRLKKERPALTGPADFFSDVLPGLFEGESKDQPPAISPEQAQAKLSAGVPLLRGELVEVDLAAFRRRWLHVARAVERHQNAAAGKALAN